MIETIIQCITTGGVIGGVLATAALIYSCFNKRRMQNNAEMVEHLLQDQRVTKVQVGDLVVERDSPEKPLLEMTSSSKSGTAALTDSSYHSYHTATTDIREIPSPIEQYDWIDLNLVDLFNLYFSFTKSSLFMRLTLTLVVLLLVIKFVKLVRSYSKEKRGDV